MKPEFSFGGAKRVAITITLLTAIAACPLTLAANGDVGNNSIHSVQITPPPAAFPTPFGQTEPTPTRLAPLGPVSQDDLPVTTRPELLEDPFGYAEILGQPGIYLVWSTDNNGDQRYYVIDSENEYLEGIRAATEAFHEARRDVDADPPGAKVLIGSGGSIVFGLASWGCGLGAVVSAAAQLYPLAGVFVGCDAITVPLTIGSAGYLLNGITEWNSFAAQRDDLEEVVESYFVQLPFADQ